MALKHLPDVFDFAEFRNASQMLVCLVTYYRADRRGLIRASQSDIALDCRLSRNTIVRLMPELVEDGLLDYRGHGRYGIPIVPKRPKGTAEQVDGGSEWTAQQVLAHITATWGKGAASIGVEADGDEAAEWVGIGVKVGVLELAGPVIVNGRDGWAYEVHWPSSSK